MQDLPEWAEPREPSYGRDSRPTYDRGDSYGGREDGGVPPGYEPSRPDATGYEPQTIWPPPGEDCGGCDVTGLTLVDEEGTEIDCDADPQRCELICCNFPAPDYCAPAWEEEPCAVPLGDGWFLIAFAVALGVYKLMA